MRRSISRVLVVTLLLGGVLCAGAVAAMTYDSSRSDRIANGVKIGGIDVGGLTLTEAHARVTDRAVVPRRRALHVTVAGRQYTLPVARAQVTSDISTALKRAKQVSRKGWIGERVTRELTDGAVDETIPLHFSYAPSAISKLTSRIQRDVSRKAVDAAVKPGAMGLQITPSQEGQALDVKSLTKGLRHALLHPAQSAAVTAQTSTVEPAVTGDSLAARYPAYIVVDRADHVLRFYQDLKETHSFPIAVGRQGLETPAGLYAIQWKETHPAWHVPNSAWAGKLAGTTVPPGPTNPIQARWMAFDGGAGIHGIPPSEYDSIGHDASHGCVRMRIPDVISLYARSPVGTPVYVS